MKIIPVAFDVLWIVSLFALAGTNGIMHHSQPVSHGDISLLFFHIALLALRVVVLGRK